MRSSAVRRLLVQHPRKGALRLNGRLPLALVFALITTFIFCRASSFQPLSNPEFRLLDTWLQLRPPRPVDPSIALIAVDGQQIRDFQKWKDAMGMRGQLQEGSPCTCATIGRDVLAEVVQRVKQAQARVIGVDIVFELPCPLHDDALLAALGHTGKTQIVLVSGTNPTPGRFNFTDMPSFLALDRVPLVASPVLYNPHGVIRAVRLLQQDPPAPGGPPVARVRPPLAAAVYLAAIGHARDLPEARPETPTQVTCGDVDVPVLSSEQVFLLWPLMKESRARDPKHAMLINWAGPGWGRYPMYSMEAVRRARPEQLARWFGGKIVLLGSSADRQFAPTGLGCPEAEKPLIDQTGEQAMAGLEIHANALDTLLQRQFIRPVPASLMWLLMVLSAWVTLYGFRRLMTWKAIALTALQLGIVFVAAALAIRSGHWLYAAIPATSLFASSISGALWGRTEARRTADGLLLDIEARDAVTATLVHDLKQPLAAINALAQILRMQEQSGKTPGPELIQRIQQQVQMALGDIDDLLTTDPNREIPLDLKHFDVTALARDLATAQSLRSSVHDIEVRAPEEGIWVDADARYLGRALNNLMDNAIKYWPDGGTVVVEIRREPGQVKVRVEDQGMGIAPEAQARLFNRFQRAVPAGVDIPGTGIGLFSVKRIIEAHRGTVHLISAPGEGSIFVMTLPLAKQPAEHLLKGSAT